MFASVRSTFASLAVRDFRYLWLGTAFGHIGFWMQIVSQGWLAYELTSSATFLGLVSAVGGVAGLVLMLPAGVIADRWARRGVLIWTNVVMMVCAMTLATILWAGVLEPWMLLLIVVINAGAGALNLPARQSLGPQLVGPSLVSNSIALMALSFNLSRWLGPAAAGALIAVVGIGGAFAVQAGFLALATGFTVAIQQEPTRDLSARRHSVVQNLVDGLRYTWHEPIVRATIIVSVLHNGLGLIYTHLMPVFAGEKVFDIGAPGLGALMASVGIGATAGALAASVLSTHPRKGFVALLTGAGCGLAMAMFALVPWPLMAMLALVLVGCVQTLSMTATQMILNVATPDEYRGRAMSVYMMTWNAAPLSALPAGWIADQIGAPLTVAGSGLITVIAFLIASVALVGLRRFRDDDYLMGLSAARRAQEPGALVRS